MAFDRGLIKDYLLTYLLNTMANSWNNSSCKCTMHAIHSPQTRIIRSHSKHQSSSPTWVR